MVELNSVVKRGKSERAKSVKDGSFVEADRSNRFKPKPTKGEATEGKISPVDERKMGRVIRFLAVESLLVCGMVLGLLVDGC